MKIVYFSHTGHSMKIAEILGTYLKEEPLEIRPLEPYPRNLEECSALAKKQIEEGTDIAIRDLGIPEGERIYLVFPSWYRRIPQPVVSFIKKTKPKTIVAIVSSYEGELGNCDMVMKGLCSDFMMVGIKQGNEENVIKVLYSKARVRDVMGQ